ncbi:MAG: nodulation protein NfeD [Gammaproteobacteria bacterium]|nr:nodulation protein NfeD [Gammaproteobacteria bacterium]MDH5305285.1 nodulation protein NfeD [Gammaproteobacteria bacterium]
MQRFMATIAAVLVLGVAPFARGEGVAVALDLEGAIGVATAEYIISGIEDAAARDATLVIIRMDTPGGLVNSMRDIVSAILGADVPVVTYVSPAGARADSAGTYILLASHVAAMAPTTHLGAATPVGLGGEDIGDDQKPAESTEDESQDAAPSGSAMERKVMNDAISYIRGLAEAHGRNADWAEKAVTEAATLTASEALEMNVIDLVAANESELLQQINGRELTVNQQRVTLDTTALVIENIEPGWRIKFLSTIASPEILLILIMLGVYGLWFEGTNPGAILPGVVGVICLLLAAYALQVLPVNYAGLALIVVGIALIAAEAFVPSFGALGFGGIAAFIFGAIMMFDSGIPGYGVSISFVVGFAVIAGLMLLWMLSYLIKLRRRGAVTGKESMLGSTCIAMESFAGEGRVWLEGAPWAAVSKTRIEKDQPVVVRAIDGLTLEVEPANEYQT